MFTAIYLQKTETAVPDARLEDLENPVLQDGEVRVQIEYSTLNYKDALAITGAGPVVKKFPMVPGIDFAGVVRESRSDKYSNGDRVLLNGFGVGESHWGGLALSATVPGDWLVPIPEGMSARTAMAIGTAGYTAMLSVHALVQQGVTPSHGEILVSGANGGVGSFAIALLAKRGYRVVASTGRLNDEDYLRRLGATEVMDRYALSKPGRPLGKERWAGAVDSVGSHTLANICAATKYGGVVTSCGLAQGMDLPGSVAPFILRGIRLIGIDSVYAPMPARIAAWKELAVAIDEPLIEAIASEIPLSDVIAAATTLLAGKTRGRVVVSTGAAG